VPRELPDLFLVIARPFASPRPQPPLERPEIAARLNPAPLAAAAASSLSSSPVAPMEPITLTPPTENISPLNVSLASEPAVPLAKMPAPAEIPLRRLSPPVKRGNLSLFNYLGSRASRRRRLRWAGLRHPAALQTLIASLFHFCFDNQRTARSRKAR